MIEKVFTNGHVYTGESAQPWVSAFAIENGQLAALGDDRAAESWIGAQTEVIDLEGAFVMPGFVDAHCHCALQGQTEVFEHPVEPTLDLEGLLAEIRKAVTGLPEGAWAVVSPYSAALQTQVETAAALARLDEAAAGHPVIVREYSRHNRWVSSAALAAARIDASTPDPEHGTVVKDPVSGGLTGVLYESAGLPVEHAFLAARALSAQDHSRSVREGLRILNSFGITGAADAAASEQIMAGAAALDEAGELSAWVVSAMPANDHIFGFEPIGAALYGIGSELSTSHHRPNFVKVFLDGVPPARTAAFSQPYLPQPGDGPGQQTCGETLFAEDELFDVLFEAAGRNLSAIIHCTGDASIHLALNAIERLRNAGCTEQSYHLSHCQFILPADQARLAELNVVAEMSPFFWVPGPVPEAISTIVPAEIAGDIHPNRRLLDLGVQLVSGSDWPCSDTPDPWYAIHGLVTRADPLGLTPGVLNGDQAISLPEAITMCTSSAADSLGLGELTGSLKAGKSADFIVCDRNPFTIAPGELSQVRVQQTWFAGGLVYRAPEVQQTSTVGSPASALSFLYLSEPDAIAAGVTDMAGCVEAMDQTLQLLQLGDYRMAGNDGNSHGAMVTFPASPQFPNMPADGPDRRFMAMPAYLGGQYDAAGMKWYGSNLANRDRQLPRSILMFMLNDKETGAPLMLMSANLLSAYRTGAVPGVGAKYLALPDASVAAIIGPGVMGKTGLEAYAAVRPITTVRVLGRRRESAEAYREWVHSRLPSVQEVIVCGSLQEAVAGADIVHCGVSGPAGSAGYPHLLTAWLKPGAFICSVSNLSLDDDVLTDPASGLFIDNLQMYFDWQEEVGYPAHESIGIIGNRYVDLMHENRLGPDCVSNIGDVALGRRPGRTDDAQIIVFSVGGMPIEDIAWASQVYQRARERRIGIELPLWDVPVMA